MGNKGAKEREKRRRGGGKKMEYQSSFSWVLKTVSLLGMCQLSGSTEPADACLSFEEFLCWSKQGLFSTRQKLFVTSSHKPYSGFCSSGAGIIPIKRCVQPSLKLYLGNTALPLTWSSGEIPLRSLVSILSLSQLVGPVSILST